MKSSLIRYCHW